MLNLALYTTLVLGVAVGTVSMTIARAGIFRGFRQFVLKKSAFLGELTQCPYCVGHWFAFMAVAYYRPRLIVSHWLIVDLAVSWLVVTCLASLSGGLIYRAFHGYLPHEGDEEE